MYLGDILGSLLRRWYLVLASLVIATSACFLVSTQVTLTYVSSAYVVLIPPADSQDPDRNRLLSLSDVETSVDVVARSMGSADTAKALAARAPEASYLVAGDPTTSAPVLTVTTTSVVASQAQTMLEAVLARIPLDLRSIQDSVQIARSRQITSVLVSSDSEPVTDTGSRVRILAVAFVSFMGVLVLGVAAFDGLLLRRRRETEELVPVGRRRRAPARGVKAGVAERKSDRMAEPSKDAVAKTTTEFSSTGAMRSEAKGR